jgi:hypothetical protein
LPVSGRPSYLAAVDALNKIVLRVSLVLVVLLVVCAVALNIALAVATTR